MRSPRNLTSCRDSPVQGSTVTCACQPKYLHKPIVEFCIPCMTEWTRACHSFDVVNISMNNAVAMITMVVMIVATARAGASTAVCNGSVLIWCDSQTHVQRKCSHSNQMCHSTAQDKLAGKQALAHSNLANVLDFRQQNCLECSLLEDS